MMDALFEGAGGFDRALAWIEKNDDNYAEFFKLYARGQARATNVEHNMGEGVEKLLEQLDERERAENAMVINGVAHAVDTENRDS